MSIRHIHRATLQTWLTESGLGSGEELALLDLRSVEAFAKGHPLFATNLPAENLERDALRFVPRKSVRLVLVDNGDGAAAKGAAVLEGLGYTDINVLTGGIPAWTADGVNGLPTFDIPGIIFTESVRDLRGTPSIEAAQLKKLYDAKEDVIVIDTRTREEFARGHVPGAVNAPGEEILYRFLDQVPNPDTFVVVSCAGLPRAIIGAQTLIDAHVPNRVAFLEDGTAGWTRATLELATGGEKRGSASAAATAFGVKHAHELAKRARVRTVDQQSVADWLADTTKRTTYLLDIRSTEEYEAGHVPGSISAPGGQLLAVSHRTVATRGARLVLIDDDGTRAVTSAYWLQQRGWEVHLLENALTSAGAAPAARVPELLNS
ncbi:rhodanese-like domain-containing protein [Caballeronia sp. dw_276]|jgi:rhodanese-related sulfurtransferase|uniref:rhodanese-like domain-containing protein n=1 Tax=Caballeronia sp. dw_276 TaxID=2719795 RepID=UPI001BD531C2|nr:rhodanese-like domain-containing protein [Caballeronia sp. dw_276]